MRRDPASERQVQAADPAGSTWLSANAGSGKTRVLTDRVARLLLEGVEPQHVLCLTYTKAAASEMQNRLFRRLGEWAMLDEARLRRALDELGVEGGITGDTLARARRLFARAIETPGGLKIQTIHSFCAALLRRFPLEAGVTPQFIEMDDRSARLLRDEIVEDLADGLAPGAVAAIARAFTGEELSSLTAEIARHRDRFGHPLSREDALAAFGLPAGMDESTLLSKVFLGGEAEWLTEAARIIARGSTNDVKAAASLLELSLLQPNLADLAALEGVLLKGSGAKEPFTAKIGSLPTKATQALLGPLLPRLDDLMRRVEEARPLRLALVAAERALALHEFANAFLPEYAARKATRGWLDFDDLIVMARNLLTEPSVAQWVLFRLDGGIDHILVDEAQDTSPDQWKVIELLAQEFTAGRGARDLARTIFVVGDKKQSIYSFQGADLRAFDRMRAHFRSRLAEVSIPLQDLELEYSFRSSEAVLRLVDHLFDERRGKGLGGPVSHIAYRSEMPGRVDLWPVIEPVSNPEPDDWTDPVDLIPDTSHIVQLARRIAAEIRRMIAQGVRIETKDGPRPVHEGDFLILVQRRSVLFQEIIRACKSAGLAIAGADRLKLGAELAVRDFSALLSFLATPEDSLSLAAALRSPLFGWSEAQLFDLAAKREQKYLWEAMRARADEFPETMAALEDLRDHADFLRPFDLIERVLTRHDGRRRMLARLGPEAEDGIDELLSQALAYERMDVPSLTGFLTWLETDEVEVKRQLEGAGRRIRVMTVHGAKGLEAPIVFLPDTAQRRPQLRDEVLVLEDGMPVWKTATDDSPREIQAARQDIQTRQEEENRRLLYVAITRAESWLIVCAAGKTGQGDAWYDEIGAAMEHAGAGSVETGAETGTIQRLEFGLWPEDEIGDTHRAETSLTMPDWAVSPVPVADRGAALLSPSDLGGAKALAGEGAELSGDDARRRGRLLHRLLEHLPLWPEVRWSDLAPDLLASGEDVASPSEVPALLAEARAVLTAPDLAPLFAPETLAEVDITAEWAGQRLFGTIDRLIVTDDRVLAIDFKSNAVIPATEDEVPEGILRQMGAYAEALRQVFPGMSIETAILWTGTATLMPLSLNRVTAAFHSAPIP